MIRRVLHTMTSRGNMLCIATKLTDNWITTGVIEVTWILVTSVRLLATIIMKFSWPIIVLRIIAPIVRVSTPIVITILRGSMCNIYRGKELALDSLLIF